MNSSSSESGVYITGCQFEELNIDRLPFIERRHTLLCSSLCKRGSYVNPFFCFFVLLARIFLDIRLLSRLFILQSGIFLSLSFPVFQQGPCIIRNSSLSPVMRASPARVSRGTYPANLSVISFGNASPSATSAVFITEDGMGQEEWH